MNRSIVTVTKANDTTI